MLTCKTITRILTVCQKQKVDAVEGEPQRTKQKVEPAVIPLDEDEENARASEQAESVKPNVAKYMQSWCMIRDFSTKLFPHDME